jgi:hypothetical protein
VLSDDYLQQETPLNGDDNSIDIEWRDPNDEPDLSPPDWAARLEKVPARRGASPKTVRKDWPEQRQRAWLRRQFRRSGRTTIRQAEASGNRPSENAMINLTGSHS